MTVWGYKELSTLIGKNAGIKSGVILDANVLISATYELDRVHEQAIEFIELLIKDHIPMFVNVNARSEFLEVQGRIIFSEVILDFESRTDKKMLPPSLAGKLTKFRNKYERRLREIPSEPPTRLSEAEIKEFKMEMVQVYSAKERSLDRAL